MSVSSIEQHYTRSGLVEAIRQGLRQAGKDPDRLTLADLAPVDEFHIRGRQATRELAERLKPTAADHVLDLGCGLGGASRFLAATYGCHVIGIDITAEYCRAATTLAEWVGLADRTEYRQADALRLPCEDGTFSLVWTQHAAMNIADKARLYAEARRVLRPGGRLALYDVLQGPGRPVRLPAPWAREPSISHLATAEELRQRLDAAGFAIESWRDTTAEGRAWFTGMSRRLRESGLPPLSIALLLGPEFATMAENQRRNLEEGRTVLVEAVCQRR